MSMTIRIETKNANEMKKRYIFLGGFNLEAQHVDAE
jgi:hypothetical protein